MPLPDNLLNPIPGENPSGEDLRYAPIYDQIKEARREEEEIAQGDWVHDVKKADYPLVVKLATEVIATQSKDLQIAAWLTDALIRTEGFAGLKQGLQLLYDLTTTFWDTVYPQLEDGDAELRASPLQWVGTSIGFPLRSVALDRAGHGWVDYTESRKIPTEEQADTDEKVTARRKALSDGKLAPEVFDKSFGETPKADYKAAEAALDESAKIVETFDSLCRDKFGDAAPGFTDLKRTLQEVRHTVHLLLQKKRETDPDPVEAQPEGTGGEATARSGRGTGGSRGASIDGPRRHRHPLRRQGAGGAAGRDHRRGARRRSPAQTRSLQPRAFLDDAGFALGRTSGRPEQAGFDPSGGPAHRAPAAYQATGHRREVERTAGGYGKLHVAPV